MDREQIRLTVRGGGPVAVWTNNWFAPPPAAKRSLKLQASMHLPLRAWKMRYRDVHSPKSPFPNPQFGNEGNNKLRISSANLDGNDRLRVRLNN